MIRFWSPLFLLLVCLSSCTKPAQQYCQIPHTINKTMKFSELKPEYQKLLNAASEQLNKSYAPYSKFHVGSAVLAKDGTIVAASNVENAAYGSCICAERSALVSANAQGKRDIVAIAITAIAHEADGRAKPVPEPVAPCGACRQMIYEFATDNDIEVIMSNTAKDKIIIKTIGELLPMAFGPKDLK